jgi:hypothetical protein
VGGVMDTKTVSLDINWVDDICGLNVKSAIEYLQTLNPEHELSYYMEGDTHGVEIIASVHYEVPLTKSEMLAKIDARYQKQIKHYEDAKKYYIERGQTDRLENCDKQIEILNEKWRVARQKYKD